MYSSLLHHYNTIAVINCINLHTCILYHAVDLNGSGRMDFDNSIREVVIQASDTRDDYSVSIPITRDTINEASEGFMIVISANEAKSNPEDIKNLRHQDNGEVTLAVINDDDSKLYNICDASLLKISSCIY